MEFKSGFRAKTGLELRFFQTGLLREVFCGLSVAENFA